MPMTGYPQHSKLSFYTRKSWVYVLFLTLLNEQRKVLITQHWAWWENQAGTLVDVRICVESSTGREASNRGDTEGISRASCKNTDAEGVQTAVLFAWAIHSIKSFLGNPRVEWEKGEQLHAFTKARGLVW